MKKLIMMVLGLMCAVGMAGMAIAGNIDSPGAPSAGSGMYSLQNLYDYLTTGAALTIPGSFQEPSAGPGSTMKSTKAIGDDVKALFVQCPATTADVKSGVKFFSTVSGSWGVKTGTMAPGSLYNTLLKTGQTSVYQTNDDGTYKKGTAFSYSWDSGTDTVKDNVTGLIWPSNAMDAGCNGGSQNLNWSNAIVWAEALNFAGYTDWRLPNITELQSLLVRSYNAAGVFINTTYFSIYGSNYMSSTTSPGDSTMSYDAMFSYDGAWPRGDVQAHFKPDAGGGYRVRAIRGGQ